MTNDYDPFITGFYDGRSIRAFDVQTKLDMVKRFNLQQCWAALATEQLQKTVKRALERRIIKLQSR
jgi:hypothetical protein